MTVILLFCLAACVYSNPISSEVRLPRAPAYGAASSSANSGAFAGAGGGAIASAGTAVFPGPGVGTGTYAGNYGFGQNSGSSQYAGGFGGGGGGGVGGGTYANGAGIGSFAGPASAFASAGPGFPFYGYGIPPFFHFTPFGFTGFPNQFSSAGNPYGVNGGGAASSYGYYGSQGGYGSANVQPSVGNGLDVRMGIDQPVNGPVTSDGGSFPPPSGGFYGISSFSSSGSSDINGKNTGYKTSSVSVNDNGKVTTYTAHDP